MATASLPASLQEVLKHFQDKYGPNAITVGAEQDIELVSTGLFALDYILGGGLPRGRIVLLYGPENSGKSTLAYHILASVLRSNPEAWVAVMPVEYRWDPAWASMNGLDLARVVIPSFSSGEEVFNQLYDLGRMGVKGVLIDSLAALLPRSEKEAMEATKEEDRNREFVALQARLLSQKLRAVNPPLSKAGAITIFTNQIREKPGVMFANPETQPGGHAILHYASTTMEVRRGQLVDSAYEEKGAAKRDKAEEGEPDGFGHFVHIRTVKTSHSGAVPFARTRLVLRYGYGFDDVYDRYYMARRTGILKMAGPMVKLTNPLTGQDLTTPDGQPIPAMKGKQALLEALADLEHPVRLAVDHVLQAIIDKRRQGQGLPLAEGDEADDGGTPS